MTAVAPRFELREEIGSGPDSDVHAAFDRESGREVALKRPRSAEAESRLRFRLAHHALASVAGPGVLPVYAVGADEAGDYCAMALADGPGLPAGPIDLEAFRPIMAAMGQAVETLHRRGVIHGALTPESFRRDAEGHLWLLDAGKIGQGEADPREDVRGLAAIAYTLLTGSPAAAVGEPRRSLARPDLPAAAARVIESALATDPDERPASVPALLAAIGLPAEPPDYLLLGSHTVGLAGPCAEAESQLDRQRGGDRGALVITGPTGAGKSRLLTALAEGLATTPQIQLVGRGEAPYALLAALLATIEPRLESAGLTPDDERWAALRVFRPAWGQPPEPIEPRAQEGRLRLAISRLLEALAGETGLLIAIDDWDLADGASRDLLTPLAQRPGGSLLWLLTQRQPAFAPFDALALPPLGEAEVAALTEAALGAPPPPALPGALLARSAGRPGPLRTLLRAFLDRGQLARRRGAWAFDPLLGEDLAFDPDAMAAVAIEGLSAPAWETAKVAAVLGRVFTPGALAAAAGPQSAGGLADLLATGAVAWQGPALAFPPSVHEAVLAAITPEEAPAIHHQAAALAEPGLAGQAGQARHRVPAGAPEHFDEVIATARQVMAQGGLTAAQALATAIGPWATDETRRQTLDRLTADLARWRGEGRQAVQLYEAVIARNAPAQARAADLWGLGRARLIGGAPETAEAALEEALTLVREAADPALEARVLVTLGRSRYMAGDERAQESAEAALSAARLIAAPALEAEALGLLGQLRQGAPAREALTEALALHRRLANPLALIETASALGDRLLEAGELRAAAEAFAEALAAAQAIGARREALFARLSLARAALEMGRPGEAAEGAERAIAMAQDDAYGLAEGWGWVLAASSRLALGEWGEARRALEEGLQLAARTGQRELTAAARMAQGQLLLELGELAPAGEVIQRELEHRLAGEDPVAIARAQLLKGRWLTLKGQLPEARELLVAARDAARDHGARLLTAQLQNALAYRALLADVPLEVLVFAQAALELAEAIGARGLEAEANWLLGEAARLDAESDKALAHYEQVLRAARLAKTPLPEALALLGLSRVGFGPQAAESREHGARILKRLARLAGKERFVVWPERRLENATSEAPQGPLGGVAAMGAVIEALAASSTWPELLSSLLETFLAASEAENGAIVVSDDDRDLAALAGLTREALDQAPPAVTARLDRRAIFEEDRWALALGLEGEAFALIYLDGAEEARMEVVRQMAEAARVVIGQFRTAAGLRDREARLTFAVDLARQALTTPSEEVYARALQEGLKLSEAERAFLLTVEPDGDCAPRLARDWQGRALPADTPFARALCREAASARRGVTLEPAREAGPAGSVQLGVRTAVAVPVIEGGVVLGVLYADGEAAAMPAAQAVWEEAARVIAPLLAREA